MAGRSDVSVRSVVACLPMDTPRDATDDDPPHRSPPCKMTSPSDIAPPPPARREFDVWCIGCRLGRHDECTAVIVILSGWLQGQHRCACTSPHSAGNGVLVVK